MNNKGKPLQPNKSDRNLTNKQDNNKNLPKRPQQKSVSLVPQSSSNNNKLTKTISDKKLVNNEKTNKKDNANGDGFESSKENIDKNINQEDLQNAGIYLQNLVEYLSTFHVVKNEDDEKLKKSMEDLASRLEHLKNELLNPNATLRVKHFGLAIQSLDEIFQTIQRIQGKDLHDVENEKEEHKKQLETQTREIQTQTEDMLSEELIKKMQKVIEDNQNLKQTMKENNQNSEKIQELLENSFLQNKIPTLSERTYSLKEIISFLKSVNIKDSKDLMTDRYFESIKDVNEKCQGFRNILETECLSKEDCFNLDNKIMVFGNEKNSDQQETEPSVKLKNLLEENQLLKGRFVPLLNQLSQNIQEIISLQSDYDSVQKQQTLNYNRKLEEDRILTSQKTLENLGMLKLLVRADIKLTEAKLKQNKQGSPSDKTTGQRASLQLEEPQSCKKNLRFSEMSSIKKGRQTQSIANPDSDVLKMLLFEKINIYNKKISELEASKVELQTMNNNLSLGLQELNKLANSSKKEIELLKGNEKQYQKKIMELEDQLQDTVVRPKTNNGTNKNVSDASNQVEEKDLAKIGNYNENNVDERNKDKEANKITTAQSDKPTLDSLLERIAIEHVKNDSAKDVASSPKNYEHAPNQEPLTKEPLQTSNEAIDETSYKQAFETEDSPEATSLEMMRIRNNLRKCKEYQFLKNLLTEEKDSDQQGVDAENDEQLISQLQESFNHALSVHPAVTGTKYADIIEQFELEKENLLRELVNREQKLFALNEGAEKLNAKILEFSAKINPLKSALNKIKKDFQVYQAESQQQMQEKEANLQDLRLKNSELEENIISLHESLKEVTKEKDLESDHVKRLQRQDAEKTNLLQAFKAESLELKKMVANLQESLEEVIKGKEKQNNEIICQNLEKAFGTCLTKLIESLPPAQPAVGLQAPSSRNLVPEPEMKKIEMVDQETSMDQSLDDKKIADLIHKTYSHDLAYKFLHYLADQFVFTKQLVSLSHVDNKLSLKNVLNQVKEDLSTYNTSVKDFYKNTRTKEKDVTPLALLEFLSEILGFFDRNYVKIQEAQTSIINRIKETAKKN